MYRIETVETSAFMETSFGGNKGQEVCIVQELRNCPVSKYVLILTNVRNLEEGISLLMYMLIMYAN
jgi:hypothetical protein